MQNKKLVSIIIPAYMEEKNILLIYQKLKKIMGSLADKYRYEIIFINDGSTDDTRGKIKDISKNDTKIKGIHFTRNFGHQAALSAGFDATKGDIIITMDADLQHPPELIPIMLQKYEKGKNIVYARPVQKNLGFFKKNLSKWYYKILSKISDTQIPENVGDFRLIDIKVLHLFLSMKERDKYIRGMIAWTGFSYDFIDFHLPNRIHGKSHYSWKKMWKLAGDGIVNFSTFPLQIALILGILVLGISILFFLYIVIDFFIFDTPYPLYKWLVVVIFGFLGLQFIFMWILGEYIGRIYNQVRNRPSYIIGKKVNFDENTPKNISDEML